MAELQILTLQAILFGFAVYGVNLITEHQQRPYMDEIFHIPQAQKYCNGSFQEWDPMITTLPGLYLFSVGVLKPVTLLLNLPVTEGCSVAMLRLVNTLFSSANLYILYAICKVLHKNKAETFYSLKAAVLSLMPLLYFFNFLYYTDPGSLFFVLYSYYFSLRSYYPLSAILGIISLLFRQTNIIWIFFMALCNVVKVILKQQKIESSTSHSVSHLLFHSLPVFIINVLITSWSYAVVGLMSVVFVLWNGSIVVGDKTAHQACFHPSQLGYYATFTLLLSFPHHIHFSKLRGFLRALRNNKIISLVALTVFVFTVHRFSHEHPYLLADNRHYTFYVWSKFFRRYEWFRYAMIPVYMFALWSIDNSLSHIHWAVRTSLWFCVIAATVPQKLMEFRYFIIPFLLVRLHMRNESHLSLLTEGLLYLVINVFTFYVFLYKPIFWPNIHEPQRIMW